MSTEKVILDISKAITAASGFAQGLETQDLEGGVTKTNVVTPPKNKKKKKEDDDDESGAD